MPPSPARPAAGQRGRHRTAGRRPAGRRDQGAPLLGPRLAPHPVGTTHPAGPGTAAGKPGQDRAQGALRALAGLCCLAWSFRLSGYLTLGPWLALPVAVLGLGGLLAVCTAWRPGRGPAGPRWADWAVLAGVLAGLALWSWFQVFTAPDYGTDEIAFDQYAAQLALSGLNPYLHSMAAAFPLFHVSPDGYTFTLSGRPVTTLSYPALSFEAYLPLIAAGLRTQAAVCVDVAAWAASGVLMFLALPRRLAPLAAVLISADVYTGYAVGGVTDFLFVPLLIGAAAGWDQFGRRRGAAAWRGPALLGLAMAVKQTPWLVAPFVLAGLVLEARARHGWRQAARDGGRYAAIALAAFTVPNLPYLVSAPGAWLRGVTTPLAAQVVPAGQGLVSLSLSLGIGGGSLRAYTVAAAVVLMVALACFAATYPLLKPAAFVLPSVVLFFATRSFGSYLVMLVPAGIVAAATSTRPGWACWRHWRWVAAGGLAAVAAAVAIALTAASPLKIAISSVRTTGQLATVDQVRLQVTNTSDAAVRPAFTVQDGVTMTAFWRRTGGPVLLGPHQRAVYTIEAPSYFAMPPISSGFQVLAFGQHPASVSRASSYLASKWRVVLRPADIAAPVARGQQITVRAQLVNRLDAPLRVAHVPVYLGQVIYDQRGIQFSQAQINQGAAGQTPVQALTNAQGVATFRIRSQAGGPDPVYFEANLVQPDAFYPYGYSPILAVRFRS